RLFIVQVTIGPGAVRPWAYSARWRSSVRRASVTTTRMSSASAASTSWRASGRMWGSRVAMRRRLRPSQMRGSSAGKAGLAAPPGGAQPGDDRVEVDGVGHLDEGVDLVGRVECDRARQDGVEPVVLVAEELPAEVV